MILKYSNDAKIDLEARDNQGRTPLHYLFRSIPEDDIERSKETIELFLKAAKEKYNIEFDLTARDKDGLTPPQIKSAWLEEDNIFAADFL